MVYCDGVHLIADDLQELHQFAIQIGLKRCWFENKRHKKQPHYDVKGLMAEKAFNNGAIKISPKSIVLILDYFY